jgi:Carboxypeptidase regulatory-like domain
MSTLSRVMILAVLLSAAGAVAEAQAQTAPDGRVTGRTVDPSGAVLPGVNVTLTGGAMTRNVVAGNDGRFVFDGMTPGLTYVLRAELPGFISESLEIGVSRGETRSIEVRLYVDCIVDLTVRIPDLGVLAAPEPFAVERQKHLVRFGLDTRREGAPDPRAER